VMRAGAVCGGHLGGMLIKVLAPSTGRAIVIAFGIGMTGLYGYRYWM